jgi:hypothetical protein
MEATETTTTPWRELGFDDEQALAISRAYRIKYARWAASQKNILEWGWALFPEKFTADFCKDFHEYLSEIRLDPFTATKGPRYHAKTTIACFLIPVFQTLEEPATFRHYLQVQATIDKALEANRSIKLEIEANDLIREMYGDQVGPYWTDTRFVTKSGIIHSCISTGQSIRGINYRNVRPDYIMADDLYNEENINNPESTEKINRWFWGSLFLARTKTRRSCVHLTGTAINDFDLLTQCETNLAVKCRTFKNLDFEHETVLWPALGDYAHQKAEFDKMPISVAMREMQNEPRDEATAIVKRHWLYAEDGTYTWEYNHAELDRQIRTGQLRLISVTMGNDPSVGKKGEKKGGVDTDPTGTALVWETAPVGGKGPFEYWIVGAWNARLSLDERRDQLLKIGNSQPTDRRPRKVFIEAISGFDDYATYVSKSSMPVDRVEWVPDKLTNLENRSHLFQQRVIHINAALEPGMKKLIEYQLTVNHPTHDDVRDAILLTLPLYTKSWKAWV